MAKWQQGKIFHLTVSDVKVVIGVFEQMPENENTRQHLQLARSLLEQKKSGKFNFGNLKSNERVVTERESHFNAIGFWAG